MSTLVISIFQISVALLGAVAGAFVLKRTIEADGRMLKALDDPEARA